jgi:GT2 family glycosyltransferase
MKLSVVVPVHDGGSDLRACLEAIGRSSRPPDEILVVDDGSNDDSAAVARELGARVFSLTDGPHGPARARNRGAARCSGEVLVFVDADVEVHPDTLGRFERALADDPQLAGVFGSYDDRPPAPGNVSRYKNLLHHFVHQRGAGEAETFWAGCGAIRREVFKTSGGFCEAYRRPSIEDIELGARLRAAGHRIRLAPDILCTHRKRWTLRSLLHTDIFARAVPWTRLILSQGRLPAGLNTDRASRWSAAFAVLAVVAVLAAVGALAARRPLAAAGAAAVLAAAVVAVAAWNRSLYRFFFAHGGWRFRLTAVSLHFLYLLYSSAVFAGLLAFERLTGGAPSPGHAEGKRRTPASARRRHAAGFILFVALFSLYVGKGDPLPGADAVPNVHLAANLLARGSLAYTPESHPSFFRWRVVQDGRVQWAQFRYWQERLDGRTMRELLLRGELHDPQPYYYLSKTRKPGVYVSSYGAATGLFALPFVAAVAPFVPDLRYRTDLLWFLGKLAASFGVAASAWLLFVVAADRLRLSSAIWLTLAYGIGTSVWSVSSQTLWQHAPGEFFLALGMFCLFRRSLSWGAFFAGFAFALAFMCRPTNSLAVAAGFLVLLGDRRALARYVLGAAPVAVAFLLYNWHFFDQFVTFGQVTALAARHKLEDSTVLFRHSLAAGLAGVLVSPSRGVFVYSPVFVFSVWGASRIWKERRWLPLRAAAIAVAGIWLVTARWQGWWGGWCFGYRLVVDTAILLAFLAVPVMERIRARRSTAVVAGLLLLFSTGIQLLGAFSYDVVGWNNRPGFVALSPGGKPAAGYFTTREEVTAYCQVRGCTFTEANMSVDRNQFRSRLWSIRDSQIIYYLSQPLQARKRRLESVRQFLLSDG